MYLYIIYYFSLILFTILLIYLFTQTAYWILMNPEQDDWSDSVGQRLKMSESRSSPSPSQSRRSDEGDDHEKRQSTEQSPSRRGSASASGQAASSSIYKPKPDTPIP